ncbi:hypothetical protein [Thorsellia anophelis]
MNNNRRELLKTAQTCLDSIYQSGFRYAKAGVMLTDLVDEFHWQ